MDRRDVLRLLAVSAAGTLVSRCADGPSKETIEAQAASYDATLACTDTSQLWPAERKTREDNQYRDRSARGPELEYCFRCENFVAPQEPRACGACRTIKGPIHPLGWCKSWTLRRA